ncbi:MAG TPA: RNA polymerase sigma factor, partial [Blastocatellia bacterium]|nr:RNA polymerase sigma factor [Blastocatellia bacterium]
MKAVNTEPGERAVIEAAQRDPGRFGELYEAHFNRVYAYVARRVRDRNETEDITAEVFHQALANIRRYEWRGLPFAAWLFRIAANAIADRGRRAVREIPIEGDEHNTIQTQEPQAGDPFESFEETER